jgi:hypothetical protein
LAPKASFIRRHVKLLVLLVSVLALGVLFFLLWPIPRGMEKCASHVTQRISGPGLYDAEVSETGCWGIVGSDVMSVNLVSRVSNRDVTIFRYDRKNADPRLSRQDVGPTVTWLAGNRLAISIDMISSVEKEVDEKDGVRIEYHIGSIEYR